MYRVWWMAEQGEVNVGQMTGAAVQTDDRCGPTCEGGCRSWAQPLQCDTRAVVYLRRASGKCGTYLKAPDHSHLYPKPTKHDCACLSLSVCVWVCVCVYQREIRVTVLWFYTFFSLEEEWNVPYLSWQVLIFYVFLYTLGHVYKAINETNDMKELILKITSCQNQILFKVKMVSGQSKP